MTTTLSQKVFPPYESEALPVSKQLIKTGKNIKNKETKQNQKRKEEKKTSKT